MENFTELRRLGSGSYGTAVLVRKSTEAGSSIAPAPCALCQAGQFAAASGVRCGCGSRSDFYVVKKIRLVEHGTPREAAELLDVGREAQVCARLTCAMLAHQNAASGSGVRGAGQVMRGIACHVACLTVV